MRSVRLGWTRFGLVKGHLRGASMLMTMLAGRGSHQVRQFARFARCRLILVFPNNFGQFLSQCEIGPKWGQRFEVAG